MVELEAEVTNHLHLTYLMANSTKGELVMKPIGMFQLSCVIASERSERGDLK